jgi:broad specificity phosphatase PhoE
MKLLVTRHGQTDWNVQKKVMGRCDEPLNEKGLEQAEETRKNLLTEKIDLIICSPLQRAKQTAEVINKDRNIPIIYDERIIERDFGEFEGKETKDFDFFGYWDYYKNEKYERAENIQEFFKRVYSFLDDILLKYKDKNVLIVAHGGISVPIACYFNKNIPEGSLVEAGLVLGNCQVVSYNVNDLIKRLDN